MYWRRLSEHTIAAANRVALEAYFLLFIWLPESPLRLLTWSQFDRFFFSLPSFIPADAVFQQASDVIASDEERTSRNTQAGSNLI